jgi:hypothetical protein
MKCQDKNKCCYLCHRFADDCEGIVPKKIISCGDCILVDDCTYEENQEYQAELKREREYIQGKSMVTLILILLGVVNIVIAIVCNNKASFINWMACGWCLGLAFANLLK